ncbi:VgrG-related protein [Nostoc sp. FACHB-892]|uniref:VgrG-related protein n=1 Tax=Nostoc sp. FACHB-892 TaxID=2692843 RepID=UPI00168A0979|nr:VgrG-related protein [Nostoc sp. FACHB-892]MBD2726642.1 VgrG-related protein [Nostoc sp. FACHB-892]
MSTESLYLSKLKIQVDGETASRELIKDVLQMTIEESCHLPAMFTLVIRNRYASTPDTPENKPWRHEQLFKIGKGIKLGFGSSTTQDKHFTEVIEKLLFEGEITGLEVNFDKNNTADIIVRGYDISHRLHRGRYNRAFEKKFDSDIVEIILGEVGIPKGNIEHPDGEGHKHEYVFVENQTYMEFLRERAARIGFELFMSDGKMNFCKPKAQGDLALNWGDNINKFRVRVTSAEQVSSVQVRAWDYTQKEPIIETASKEKQLTETGNQLGSSTSSAFSNLKPYEMIVVDKPVANAEQAKTMAQALCDELGGEFVYADAEAEGNPEIRPGKVISLEKIGDRYSGKYYVTDTRHYMDKRIYKTDFSVRGLRSGNLFTTLSTEKRLRPSQTLLIGIVTNNREDPLKLGRVKVKFPTLTTDHESNWARVVSVGAGPDRGFDCLPEVDDEVLVGFEHGDITRPYVLGGLWNGKAAPPESVDNSVGENGVRLRTFKTRVGHTLQFIDEEKGLEKAGIRLKTKEGHRIYMNDDDNLMNSAISLRTKGSNKIDMNDSLNTISVSGDSFLSLGASNGVFISSTLGYVSMSTTVGKISISTTLGPIEMSTKLGKMDIFTGIGAIGILSGGPVSITGVPVITNPLPIMGPVVPPTPIPTPPPPIPK